MSAVRGRALGILASGLTALAVSAVAASGASAATPVRIGRLTPLPSGARVTGALPSSKPVQLTIALQPQDPAGLQALATATATPGSAQFRHYLTVSQFVQRFGAAPAAIAAVSAALRAQGLTVGPVTANHLMLPVSGTATQVENALSVSLVQVKFGAHAAHANVEAPAVPSSIAKYVQGVIGLNSVTLDQPQGVRVIRHAQLAPHRATSSGRPAGTGGAAQAIGSGPAPCPEAGQFDTADNQYGGQGLGYTADEVAGAYGLNPFYQAGDEGAGETVALFEEEPYQVSDVTAYQSCYGTRAPVTNVDVDGGPGQYNPNTDDDGEAALDIDQVIGLAPKANILVYQGPSTATSPADILGAIVSQDRAQVISSSWGRCEGLTEQAVISSENTTLQEAAVQGQSFFISSGDSGAEMCYQATRSKGQGADFSLSVIDPGGQPFATGVGGTSMGTVTNQTWQLPDNGSYPGEFVWNDGVPGGSVGDQASGSGGGVSDQWPMPFYQSGAAGSLNVISTGSSKGCANQFCRQVPDVSADSDPNSGYVVYANGGSQNGGWTVTGGTSAAAPLWAAFTALANASPACRGLSLGFVNPALYKIAGSSFLNNFHDITQASPFTGLANNDTFGGGNPDDPNQLYPLQTGYDMATGLGSPIGNALGGSLCAVRAPTYAVGVANPGTLTSAVHRAVALQIHGSDSGGAALHYAASGLPAGLSINAGTGVISGTPTTTAASTVSVTATDDFRNVGGTSFKWRIVKPGSPAVSKASLRGLPKRKPKLSFTIQAGANAPAIGAFSVSLPGGLKFAKSAKSLSKGISVKAGGKKTKVKLKVRHGKLTVTLAAAVESASVTISKPAISASSGLSTKVRQHKLKKLSVTVGATDTTNRTTRLGLQLKV